MKTFLLLLALSASSMAQKAGTQKTEADFSFPITVCDGGSCSQESDALTLDSNWRWTHHANDYVNCYTGNEWDPQYCPDVDTCTEMCALDHVDSTDKTGTYGITTGNGEVSLKFRTVGPYSTNIGSRVFLLDSSKTQYRMFQLLNNEFTFTVDSSQLDCGLNGALYFVEMEADGGMHYPTNEAGPAFGTGYCDAQCPHDMKWINGEANVDEWTPSETDPNAGNGRYGTCCAELDLWEANKKAQAFTTHPCNIQSQYRCEGTDCGDNSSDERYDGVCDKDGCDFASYRLGDHDFYGEGKTVDSSQPITVTTQFITSDGTDNGQLVEVRRIYTQNGQTIENSQVNFDGVDSYDSITEDMCQNVKGLFGDYDDHSNKGGLAAMGQAMGRGMVLVMSLWDDHDAHMLWLDSNYPEDADPNQPGIARGPCETSSGNPPDVENTQPDATVTFSDIKFGPIGSTL